MTFPAFSNSLNTRYSSFSQKVNGINGCNPEYVKSKEIINRYSIDSSTLRNWSKHGRIRCLSIPRKRSTINKLVNRFLNNSCGWSYLICDNRDQMAARNIHIRHMYPNLYRLRVVQA
eukprot:NODE_680_length_5258_cov_0.588486.p2 type:complete len:117 gc:universal NODE_680_length_5258_cov_0.588486:954-604(-)